MKKIVPLIIVAILLVMAIPIVMVSAGTDEDGAELDENGKIIGEAIPFDDSVTLTREQSIQYEEELKEQVVLESMQDPGLNSESSLTNEELARFSAEAQKAEERANLLMELFSKGLKIVNRYYPGRCAVEINDLQEIERDMLEAMVNVIDNNKLSQEDKNILKQCLAEKYFIVLETDSLYVEINRILGIDPN